MEELIHGLQRLVWGPGMLVFFLGTGIRFTLDSKFFQIRKIHTWLGSTLGALRFDFPVSVFLYCPGGYPWDRKHYGSGYGTDLRRTGSNFLDVGLCFFRNDD